MVRAGGEAELARGFLLQRRGGEGRRRVAAAPAWLRPRRPRSCAAFTRRA
ncbi:MAG: hypothetical protein MZV49_23870 [Rhodopseudomonas palustris]|nr:hypothetical protein [Rhodopseudomonas palustris]